MKCTCGFENAADARFCGNCRAALGDGPANAVPVAAPPTAPPAVAAVGRVPARPLPRVYMAIVGVVVVVAAAGYWWMNRPPGRYKRDNSGLYGINVNGKYGFMDRSGKTVITPQFDEAGWFYEGLADVRIGTKWGYINTKGVVVITPQFDYAAPFQYGRAAVKLCCGPYWDGSDVEVGRIGKNRYGFIDKDGKYVGTPGFLWVARSFDGDFALVRVADGRYGIMNRSGKVVMAGNVELVSVYAGFTAGLAPAATGGKWGYIDTAGKWVIDPQFEYARNFADGLAPVIVGGRTGYINEKGRFVVNPQYDPEPELVGPMNEFYDGYARFASGGKFGFIDAKGRVMSEAKFLDARQFSDGLAPVQTEDGWGFIDTTGKMVVSPQFDSATVFQNGLARVTVAGKEAYVTTAGAFVVDPFTVVASDLSHIDPAYRAMVQDWLQRHPRFGALAVMSDCLVCRKGGIYEGWGRDDKDPWDNKHPYYAVGDFNKDGQTDVAIVSKHGDLVIFNGPLRVGTTGQFVGNIVCGRATGLGRCNLDTERSYIYYKAQRDMFICGSYGTEESCSVKARGDGYLFHP